jgi:hypothetical protein
MKVNKSAVMFAVVCVIFGSAHSFPVTPGQNGESLRWGQANDGVQMSLSSVNLNGSELQVALRNVADHDVTLNLGVMMANGKVQLPNYVSLNLTDSQGRTRVFTLADKKHSFIAGRLDDYVVPLRVGSMYTLKLNLDQFWCQEREEFEITLPRGKSFLTARFQGRGAEAVNLDMRGIRLMNFWLGNVESNTLTIER